MPAATATAKLCFDDLDDLDAFLAQRGVDDGIAIIGVHHPGEAATRLLPLSH